ncbi:hypothetical protein H4582DRAFT_1812928, partial [Lactarius indigo]
ADADDHKASKALLHGLKARYDKTGKVPVYIHTALGLKFSGVLGDNAAGLHDTDIIYDDTDPEQIESLPDTAFHRLVDLEVVAADKEGQVEFREMRRKFVRTYIVLPSTIYGIATGNLFNLGISHPHSIQVPFAMKASLGRGEGGVIGEGKNIWPNVKMHERESLSLRYRSFLNSSLEAELFEYKLYDLAKAYSQALYDLGKGKSPEPTTFTAEEAYFGGVWLGSNSRCKAKRGRALGWKPTRTTKDFFNYVRSEIEAIIVQK